MIMNFRKLGLFFAVALAASMPMSVFAQSIPEKKDDAANSGAKSGAPRVVATDADLLLERVLLQYKEAGEIEKDISMMLGRTISVERNGEIAQVRNIVGSGGAFLVYDTPENVRRIQKTIELLDVKPTPRPDSRQPMVVEEFSPRYITLGDCSSALKIYSRSITTYDFGRENNVPNVSFVQDRGTIILRDTEAQVGEMSKLLRSLDVPKAQVLITCTVVEAVELSKNDTNLPQDLVKDLAELTGRQSFRTVTMGMVRTAVRSDRSVEINMNGADNVEIKLTLRAAAYDDKTEVLTLDAVQFSMLTPLPSGGRTQQSFLTSTVLPSNSYTVIGAAGSQPIFVVLRMVTAR
jgi:hypothetical protein